jgi:predicted lipoprotein with Yx(FWY)xxD motif
VQLVLVGINPDKRTTTMNARKPWAAVLAVTAFAASGAIAQTMPAMKAADGTLTDAKGMTLYTFDKDAGGKSACNGPCAANWPPLAAAPDAKPYGEWTVIARDDGSRQWAYEGKPLYRWKKDANPGDKTGDNVNNAWHVAH